MLMAASRSVAHNAGMQCRHAGMQACRHAGMQAYRHTGIQAYRHTGVHVLDWGRPLTCCAEARLLCT
jgi:hypothetical protein